MAWKHRSEKYLFDYQYEAQRRKYQVQVDLSIIYRCRSMLPEILEKELHDSIESHVLRPQRELETWLQMYKSLMHDQIKEIHEEACTIAERDILESTEIM